MSASTTSSQPASMLRNETLRILERDKHRVALGCPPTSALKLLNAGALARNLAVTKGRLVLYFS
jgi:hypothetical protein